MSDLVGGLSFWLYRGVLRSSYLLGWLAVLHLVLIFPQPHPVVIRHPRLIWLVYAIPGSLIALYIAILFWVTRNYFQEPGGDTLK